MRNRKNNTSLESFIIRYGEDDGKKRYENFLKFVIKPNSIAYSKISMGLFNNIISKLISPMYILYGEREYSIFDPSSFRQYLYDFTIPSLKYCIEFNGDLWHANPLKYKATDAPIPFYPLLTAHEIWKKDEIKQTFIKNSGYTLKIIWESDYLKNKETITNECISEINTLIKERK